ncbi:DUF3857 domain-containing protein [Paludibacterium purpuratum]|uniref:Transglutaminase superfamily protein n=1 Tax=Paludibacterium purpuratum TaxID=1144873 RepID=A0A4R7B9I4_9NEIS|nr:DUF3857 domain-containing protein [Paludibacterium purpuratum]TDR81560.1 transglutaminase superfamily protein [Paludibacterium purpuratum]
MKRLVVFSYLLAMVPVATVHAASYQPDITIVRSETRIEVSADGSLVEDAQLEVRVNTQSALAANSQMALSYNRDLEDLQIVEAATRTSSGQVLAVSPGQILDQAAGFSGQPQFGANRLRQVRFSGLEVGGRALLHWRRHVRQALWPSGQFDYTWGQSLHDQIQSASLTVTLPESMPLHWEAEGVSPISASVESGRRVWRWTLQQPNPPAPEARAVEDEDYSPHVVISSFADYAALGQAYWQGAHDKASVTPDVRRLAQRITAGKTDRHAKAVALYDWVSQHIRWVAIYFGHGGLVPHAADEVLHNGYGDCKDHATLLQALLSASGIRSSQVLIDAGYRYRLPMSAPAHEVFNHAINYLPDEHVFLDSTLAEAPFGQLSEREYGKQALVIDDLNGHGVLLQTPVATSMRDQEREKTIMTLSSDGTIHGSSHVQLVGAPELSARMLFSDLAKGDETRLAMHMLQKSGQTGTGSYQIGQPDNLDIAFSFQTHFVLPTLMNTGEPGGFVIPEGVRGFDGVVSPFANTDSKVRQFPLRLRPGHFREETQLTLPPGLSVLALPVDTELTTRFGRYQAHYRRQGAKLMVVRDLLLDWPTPWIGPSDYPDFAEMGMRILNDTSAQVIYQPQRKSDISTP